MSSSVGMPPGHLASAAPDPVSETLHTSLTDATTDDDLLAAHRTGDPDAFGELFRRHKDRTWAVAVRTCVDREIAADAVQDAFLSAFRRADTFRGEAAVTTWLHRIVVNACLDRLRRRRPTVPLSTVSGSDGVPIDLEASLADPRDDHASTEVAVDVRQALARLPEHQRVALVLVDMQEMTVAEAADVLQVPEGTVRSRCSRGRAALAELLGLRPPVSMTTSAEPTRGTS